MGIVHCIFRPMACRYLDVMYPFATGYQVRDDSVEHKWELFLVDSIDYRHCFFEPMVFVS